MQLVRFTFALRLGVRLFLEIWWNWWFKLKFLLTFSLIFKKSENFKSLSVPLFCRPSLDTFLQFWVNTLVFNYSFPTFFFANGAAALWIPICLSVCPFVSVPFCVYLCLLFVLSIFLCLSSLCRPVLCLCLCLLLLFSLLLSDDFLYLDLCLSVPVTLPISIARVLIMKSN